jgi:hypothetical protein
MKTDNYAARTRETMTANQQIARTILEQFGGGRLAVMTGAHSFVAIDQGLQFHLKHGAKDGINRVTIVLTPADDYTVTFYRFTRQALQRGEHPVVVAQAEGVYCDTLQDIFEQHTGLFTTLFARQGGN